MGLFDVFKRKQEPAEPSPDMNRLLLSALEAKLVERGHPIQRSSQYLALTVGDELEIALAELPMPGAHPLLLQALAISIHPVHFPQGIETTLIGIGETPESKARSAIENYVSHIFPSIAESLGEQHSDQDFESRTGGRTLLWHPNVGPLVLQGQWTDTDTYTRDSLLHLLQEPLKNKLADQKLNWLKLYVARQSGDQIDFECSLNNETWEEGALLLEQYARQWPKNDDFLAQKQFLVFRRCDAFD